MCGSIPTKKLEKVQKRALRFVFDDFISDYDTLLTVANVNTLFLTRLKCIAAEVFKCVSGVNVSSMNDMFTIKPNRFGLRRSKNVVQPKFNTVRYGKHSFEYIGSHIWNLLPTNIQNADTLYSFKKMIKVWNGPTCQCNICKLSPM